MSYFLQVTSFDPLVINSNTPGPEGPVGGVGPRGPQGDQGLPGGVTTVDGNAGIIDLTTKYIGPAAIVKAGDGSDLVAKVNGTTTGAVFIPRGTYTITQQLTPQAGVLIYGEGNLTKIVCGNSFGFNPAINIAHDDVTLRDFLIDGNKANQAADLTTVDFVGAARGAALGVHSINANGYGIHAGPGSTDIRFEHCIIESPRDEGIEFQGASRGAIIGNTVLNAGKNGIYVWGNTAAGHTCSDVTITGNEVYNASSGASGYAGIRADDGATNITITGNNVIAGGTAANGISVVGQTATPTIHTTITGNTIDGVTGHGIIASACRMASIQGNTVRNAGLCGIFASTLAPGLSISGNTVSGSQRSGIAVLDVTDFTITGNVCKNNGQDQAQTNYYHGITLWQSTGTVDKGVIAHNRCFDDQVTKTQQYGIRTLNTIGASVVIGPNILDGNGTSGMLFSFGGTTTASVSAWKKLTGVTVSSGGNSIPHGLPYVPQAIVICMTSAGTIWKAGGSDATNIVLMADVTSRTADVYVG